MRRNIHVVLVLDVELDVVDVVEVVDVVDVDDVDDVDDVLVASI